MTQTHNVVDLFTRCPVSKDRPFDEAERERRRKKIQSLVQTQVDLMNADRRTVASASMRIQREMHVLAALRKQERRLDKAPP